MSVEEEGKMVDVSTTTGLVDELIRMLQEVLANPESVWKVFSLGQGEVIANAIFHDPDDDDINFKNDKSMDDYVVQ
eukprot:14358183-Ditylum_brightwellii.AAC.1